jgi:hypothetical protein
VALERAARSGRRDSRRQRPSPDGRRTGGRRRLGIGVGVGIGVDIGVSVGIGVGIGVGKSWTRLML